jgi:uncharacterized membrane protein
VVTVPARLLRHVLATRGALRRAFPPPVLDRIEAAVHAGEALHDGEVRFAVEAGLDWRTLLAGDRARERALQLFSALRVWDTERNNGVLIYLLFADREVEIVADRGFNGRVDAQEWRELCDGMRERFSRGDFEAGALEGIAAVSRLMALHFPAGAGPGRDELPDRPVML